jgi:hypothetical protein
MTKPFKKTGYAQGIYEISATKKEELGTIRITQDGRIFRYAKAGASALSAGKLAMAAQVASEVLNKTAPATAIGARQLTLTIGSATYAENYFAGGYLQVNDATGEGHQYLIESSSAVTAGTSIVIGLHDPIRVALVSTSEVTLVHSPWMATVETAVEENLPIGVSPVPVTAAYYYWAQTGGPAIILSAAADAVGSIAIPGATAGAAATASATIGTTITQPIIGRFMGTVGVSTEYKPIFLTID